MKQFDHHIAHYAVHREQRDSMSSVYLQIYQIRIRARNGQRYQTNHFQNQLLNKV